MSYIHWVTHTWPYTCMTHSCWDANPSKTFVNIDSNGGQSNKLEEWSQQHSWLFVHSRLLHVGVIPKTNYTLTRRQRRPYIVLLSLFVMTLWTPAPFIIKKTRVFFKDCGCLRSMGPFRVNCSIRNYRATDTRLLTILMLNNLAPERFQLSWQLQKPVIVRKVLIFHDDVFSNNASVFQH